MRKKRTKRTNSQSEVETESQHQKTDTKRKQSPIKAQTISLGFDKLTLQKISQQVNTVASNELQSPKTVSQTKQLSFKFQSNTKSIEHLCAKQFCIPFEPISFVDWVHYESKCQQILQFLQQGVKKQDIIAWIQDNNRYNNGISTNCQLLAQIQSQQFWNVILIEMLNDTYRFSQSLNEQIIKLVTFQQHGLKKLEIGRGYCYLALIQWFFGLIPQQHHLQKQNSHCTFAPYMHKQNFDSQNEIQSQLTQGDKIRLIKLKTVLSYFSLMSIGKNQETLRKQLITIECNAFKLKQNFYLNPQKNQSEPSVICEYQEDFGPIDNEVFVEIFLRNQKSSQKNKFNQGRMSEDLYAFFQTDTVFNGEKLSNQKNQFLLNNFLLQHPQAHIAQLLFPGFANENIILSIRGLRKWSQCKYTQNKVLSGYSRMQSNDSKISKNFQRLVLSKQESDKQLTLEDYQYDRLKLKLQKYVNLIKASIKTYKQREIVINLDIMHHRDIYLNFMLLWLAISQLSRNKSHFVFQLAQLDKSTKYSIVKLHKYFVKKDIGQLLSIIVGYEKLFIEKKNFFSSIKDLSFIDYIKRHVF